jgi:hypothetical protein
MKEDRRLIRALLARLLEVESSIEQGGSVLIQPPVEGVHIHDPIQISGFNGKQIEFHLKLLLDRGLISSGTVVGEPSIGIYFSHLTDCGHRYVES